MHRPDNRDVAFPNPQANVVREFQQNKGGGSSQSKIEMTFPILLAITFAFGVRIKSGFYPIIL